MASKGIACTMVYPEGTVSYLRTHSLPVSSCLSLSVSFGLLRSSLFLSLSLSLRRKLTVPEHQHVLRAKLPDCRFRRAEAHALIWKREEEGRGGEQ